MVKNQDKKNSTILLKGGRILTLDKENTVFDPGYILIQDDKIIECGHLDKLDNSTMENSQVIELSGHLIMPGLINTHTHTCMSILRGTAEDIAVGKWLEDAILPLEAQLTPEDYYWSSSLGCLELIRNGVTCIADRAPFMEDVSKAVDESGIRGVLSLTITDKQGKNGIDRQLEMAKQWKGSSRISFGLGPHATDTCSTELLQEIKRVSIDNNMKIFIHVAQSEGENEIIRGRGYKGAVEYLDEIGFLDSNVIAAHCIYLNEDEIERFARSGAWIAHCPSSNIKIEARTAPIIELYKQGTNITIATDAVACNNRMDIFEEMKIGGLASKLSSGDPLDMPLEQLIPLVTHNAATALGLEESIGSIEPGKKADIITMDRDKPHLQPWHNDFAQLVYSARGNDVSNVLIDGVFRLKDKKFTNNNEREIMGEVKDRAKKLFINKR